MYCHQVIEIYQALHGAIWRIMKYFMQGDDFQAGRKHIKSFKGMPPGQIIYVGRY